VACTRLRLRQLGRKKYPLVRNIPRFELVSNTGFEIESLIVDIVDTDSVTVLFDSPFSSIPSVIANVVTVTSPPIFELGNVNVYVESIALDRAVIRTSAPITGKIHVHAMKIQGCDSPDVNPILTNLITQDLFDIVTQNNELIITQ
jgi:hypothetical protein